MKLIKISGEYINFLKKFDKKVSQNKNEKRPYIGIIFEIENHKYFAPLTSPKEKHLKMKDSIDFLLLKKGKLGAINLNNMIPVPEIAIINFDINETKEKELFQKQLREINSMKFRIESYSLKLYKKITEIESTFLHDRCCEFKLLEKKSLEYSISFLEKE